MLTHLVQEYIKSAKDYYMPLWKGVEISKVWNASYRDSRDQDEVRELFDQWGGCVRWVLEKPFEDSKDKLQKAVDSSTGENLLAACRGENDDKVRLTMPAWEDWSAAWLGKCNSNPFGLQHLCKLISSLCAIEIVTSTRADLSHRSSFV